MNKPELFNEKLEEATEIRIYIQDELRSKYNEYKLLFKSFTGDEGKVLKHIVDMYHYRDGGYPNPNSPPKHQELIRLFAQMVKYFDLIGFSEIYQEELKKHGITVKVNPSYKIPDVEVVAEAADTFEEMGLLQYLGKDYEYLPIMYGEAVKAFVLVCDGIQGEICSNSNVIKKELAPDVETNCFIRKGDFTQTVMVNYQKKSKKITKGKVKRLKRDFKSKVESGTFNIKIANEEIKE